MEINHKINLGFIWLIISLVFIIPLNMSNVLAAEKESVQNACGGSFGTNVKSSWVLSAVTGCLPGILEKTNELREFQCKRVVCTYESVKAGIDPSFCQREYEYNLCKVGVGELFALTPLGMLEYFRNAIANLLENPVGILWGAGKMAAKAIVNADCVLEPSSERPFACTFISPPFSNPVLQASAAFLIATDSLALAQTLMEMYNQGLSFLNGAPTYCDQVPEIRKEMEKIIKYA